MFISKKKELEFNSFKKAFIFTLFLFTCAISSGQMKMKNSPNILAEGIPISDKSANIENLTAFYSNSNAHLSWTAHNQVKEGTYIIERSEDGIHYTIEGIKKGIPTKKRKDQLFSLSTPEKGNNLVYYRIRHIANDNSVLLSKNVALSKME